MAPRPARRAAPASPSSAAGAPACRPRHAPCPGSAGGPRGPPPSQTPHQPPLPEPSSYSSCLSCFSRPILCELQEHLLQVLRVRGERIGRMPRLHQKEVEIAPPSTRRLRNECTVLVQPRRLPPRLRSYQRQRRRRLLHR